ncbi:MAG: hypothetical protein RQ966_15845 [Acetobacteraceae bacterium]|nr:hypothetical protein [Acetobacteraceae bacterium]
MGRGLIQSLLAIIAGAALFAWPALLNGYPILFSDTGAILEMGLLPSMGWDKPFVYGPLAAALSLRRSLWLVAAAQVLALSYALWAAQSAFAIPSARRHVTLCLILAAGTSAPWFASTLLPDALTGIAVLGLLTVLGQLPRRHTLLLGILTTIAIASHLSHLILAAGMIAAIALCRFRVPWRAIATISAALLYLLASNVVGHGRFAVSPYGSVFALARLIADGPARDYLQRVCPDPAIALCAWRDKLTDDSDQFLWDPASPFWSDPLPLPEFAAQAGRLVAGTILSEPWRVLRLAYRNAAHELIHIDLGDTLGPDYLAETVRPRIARWYPGAELSRFDASRQIAGTLLPIAAKLLPLQRALILFGLVGSAALLISSLRRPNQRADVAAVILLALAANAIATGSLSAIHDRYEARLVWLIVIPILFRFRPETAPFRIAATMPQMDRTSAKRLSPEGQR